MKFPLTRMRRLRKSPEVRSIIQETRLNKDDLIQPIFIKEGLKNDIKEPIKTMPDEYRYSIDDGVLFGKKLEEKGLKSAIIFGMPITSTKDKLGSPAYDKNGIAQKTIRKLKEETNLLVISDVCLCQYTNHGHCGVLGEDKVLNDKTLKYLSKVAVSHAESGADIVAPSDMMDGRVLAIREGLDKNGFEDVLIMSYSAKYASSFYYPFRDAVSSTPSFGDRKTYQMDPSNAREAIREAELDLTEGADILMIKPALAYLDIIKALRDNFNLPIATYNVSGEYSMLKNGIEQGYLTEDVIMETLISIKRAGADLIISHFTKDVLNKL
ncbi:MAG: porphobilinogen synthase [Methanobrevibacter sp.]|jgi:porphobilinogen synthase|nr:porphobilinogen synthase [Candidatus Methanovirga basalitermitum]